MAKKPPKNVLKLIAESQARINKKAAKVQKPAKSTLWGRFKRKDGK